MLEYMTCPQRTSQNARCAGQHVALFQCACGPLGPTVRQFPTERYANGYVSRAVRQAIRWSKATAQRRATRIAKLRLRRYAK